VSALIVSFASRVPAGYWLCACVMKDRRSRFVSHGAQPDTVDRCDTCGATRAEIYRSDEALKQEGKL
jgi:hypothetical protein